METVITIILCIIMVCFIPILIVLGFMLLPIAVESYVEAKKKLEQLKGE